jgi:hypothetical protein
MKRDREQDVNYSGCLPTIIWVSVVIIIAAVGGALCNILL